MEPIPYKGNRPCFGRVILGLVKLLPVPGETSGVGRDAAVESYKARALGLKACAATPWGHRGQSLPLFLEAMENVVRPSTHFQLCL